MVSNKNAPKKTLEEHSEDALYREVWEEVKTQKIIDFIKNNFKMIIFATVVVIVLVAGFVIGRNIKHNNDMEIATTYESAMNMDPRVAREALSRLANKSSGGMSDLATFNAYLLAQKAGDKADALAKLEYLSENGSTRDFRDLATIRLAFLKGDSMTGDDFQKMMSPLLTTRSPLYYSGLLLVAEKYVSENKTDKARPFLKKILSEKNVTPSIYLAAETMISK